MKKYLRIVYTVITVILLHLRVNAQQKINDEALGYQEQRMVFQQWDQDKFKPSPGFLSLNPFYWLVWGLPYPNYHKIDLRPLSATGPQTQRLALVAAMQSTDNQYKLQSDTVRNVAFSQLASQSALISGADPLWLLYYQHRFQPVLNHSMGTILAGLPTEVSAKLVGEGLYDWYNDALDRLKERIEGAHNADMDRGSRIMAYYRLLQEYRSLSGIWSVRTASAKTTLEMAARQQKLQSGHVTVTNWTPQTDIELSRKVLEHMQ